MKKNRIAIVLISSIAFLFTSACFLFSPQRGPLKFNPDNLPEAQAGVPYDVKISITQNVTPAGQFSISEGVLPKGMTLEKLQSEDKARISGTPEEAGTYEFTIFLWCYGTNVNRQSGDMKYTIVVR